MSTARVASIHFYELEKKREIYGGMYYIPPVGLNEPPFILTIEDKVQRDEGPVSGGPGGGRRQPLRYHVDGTEIAADIVGEWTKNGLGLNPDRHPGVWVVRDRLPVVKEEEGRSVSVLDGFNHQVFRPATPEETKAMWDEDLAHARRADRAYAEWCFMDGNKIGNDVRTRQFVSDAYKAAARHYGFNAEWLKEGSAAEVSPCPSCDTIISKTAMVCPRCQQPVDLDRYATWEAQKSAALRDAKKQQAA